MKVLTTVTVTQDVEVEVTLDEVMAAIAALDEPASNAETLRLLNLCMSAIRKVPDALVAGLNDAQRKIVVNVLSGELERYRETVAAAS